jgi:predicted dehydrogenase
VSRHRARLAVVGLGRIGRLHAGNLASGVRAAELVAVADPVMPLARSIGSLHDVPWSTDVGDAMAAADALVVAAPTPAHVELVETAARAGKHVFCEKPLGFDAAAAARATEACAAAGVVLQLGFQRRFDPDWLAAKDMLASGELGDLRLLRCSHRTAVRPATGAQLGDLFADMASHDLDAARWLGGEIADVQALSNDGTATLALRFASGALGLVDVSVGAGYGFECSAEVVGTGGTARIGQQAQVELLRDGQATRPLPSDHAQRHPLAYVLELEHFAAVVLGEPADGPGGEDAVAALRLVDAARRAAAS